ncbi:hypothetical protein BC936DRAFT_149605 [Jimgerdemannia flammicorona]|uniref:Uncharacterized protein n=1 Tax=Jimgerdemannia flammicorona TaxID=994334 RepID=A0A433D0I6_9FUNG|nr:hypothetical protein BC936DRAFT_149605 [Jimgerdemannia flammicorona]
MMHFVTVERTTPMLIEMKKQFIHPHHGRSQIHEVGVGENTGPNHKDHHNKVITDFVDVIKVARAQHLYLCKKYVEQCGSNPLPSVLSDMLTTIAVPFFQIISMTIRFYILLQVNGDIYAIWQWVCEDLPMRDSDVASIVLLSRRFITHRAMAEFIESDRP